jgi:hypothetical protein
LGSASIDVKSGFSDLEDFAMTRLLYFPAVCGISGKVLLRNARAAKNEPQTFGNSRKKNKMASVGSSHNGCATIGRSQPPQRYMPRDKSELEAKSEQNQPDLENGGGIQRGL